MPKTKVSSSTVTPVTTKVKKVSKSSKTKKVKEVTPKVELVQEEVVPVETPQLDPPAEETVVETVPEVTIETVASENDTVPTISKEMEENAELVPDKKNTRRTVNKETVRQNWEELFVTYEAELKELSLIHI